MIVSNTTPTPCGEGVVLVGYYYSLELAKRGGYKLNSDYGYGMWPLVIIHFLFVIFIAFLIFKPKTRTDWKSLGAFGAFLVALFTEMYGFPFTIYILTSILGQNYPVLDPFSHEHGHLLGVFFGDSYLVSLLVHPGSDLLIISALIIIATSWKRIHKSQGEVVQDGLYKHIRHPQYTGFFLIIIAFLIQWPTIITLLMAPILFVVYNRLAKKEEKKLIEEFGEDYREYMKNTNRFIPSLNLNRE